jgi:hypothetical protein
MGLMERMDLKILPVTMADFSKRLQRHNYMACLYISKKIISPLIKWRIGDDRIY